MKYCSIIITHYSQPDDFGGKRAGTIADQRSAMMKQCIESLKSNTDFPAEVIVIDNGGDKDDSDWLLQKVREGVINTYVRNKNNMHFGWARNQGIRLATSDYICISDNDILFKKNWLSKTIEPLLKWPDKRFIASPFITPDKTKFKNPRGNFHEYRLNSMAGSNCMIMTKKIYWEVRPFTTHHITGSHWHRRMVKAGYLVIVPPEDYVEHLAFRHGYTLRAKIKVKEDLLTGGEADFTFPYVK